MRRATRTSAPEPTTVRQRGRMGPKRRRVAPPGRSRPGQQDEVLGKGGAHVHHGHSEGSTELGAVVRPLDQGWILPAP
jgi:hypothetical protein